MTTFKDLGVRDDLLKAVGELGFETPMPVQEKVIPHLLNEDNDVVALAQTGTGKTAAFGLPVIQRIDISQRRPQALILAPTRELCLQIGSDLADFSKYVPRLRVLPVYGGSSIQSQIRGLREGVQIIVATPGRPRRCAYGNPRRSRRDAEYGISRLDRCYSGACARAAQDASVFGYYASGDRPYLEKIHARSG